MKKISFGQIRGALRMMVVAFGLMLAAWTGVMAQGGANTDYQEIRISG